MIDLNFVGHRCNDHSPSSGYDQVCSLFPKAGWLDGRALESGEIEWVRAPSQPTLDSCKVFHVIYGDCSGKALPSLLKERFPNARVVSTVHRPIADLKEDQTAWKAVEMSDAIITVSEWQANELVNTGIDQPIQSIPHGIWTKVFRSNNVSVEKQRNDVLIVGSFLRDWDGAKQVARALSNYGVRCIALGAGARANLSGESHIEVPPRLSEAQLAQAYADSAAVFLPFLDATASNALLEAISAGCPVICPRIPALTKEYLGDYSDSFAARRYDEATARLLHYVRNPADRQSKAHALIDRSKMFDWSRIKHHYERVFEAYGAKRQ